MESNFSAEFFKRNRTALRHLFTGKAPIVITANGLLQRSGDTTLPFHQDSNFWYLTGVDEPDVILVMDKNKEYLILPNRQAHQEVFDGSIAAEVLSQRSGIGTILDQKTGWRQLGSRLKRAKYMATVAASPAYVAGHGLYTNPSRSSLIARVKDVNSELELLDLRDHLTRLRMIKQPEELAALDQAIGHTVRALKDVIKKRSKYVFEYEVEAAISHEFRRKGVTHGYQPIVGAGLNACTLHYIQNQSPIKRGELLLIDAGAEVEHYSADITRTLALTAPTKRQQAVYDAVLDIQQAALLLLKPGLSLKLYEQKIAELMGEKLRELSLVKSIDEEKLRHYYPHGTSHFLGLDVHDVGQYEKPLEAGMVLTVEPGIYIPEEKLGVRIEDDVVVTAGGVKVLSAGLPRSLW